MKLIDKIVKGVLITILILAIIMVVYLVIIHNPGQDYTEFYILDSNHDILDYPLNVSEYSFEMIHIGIANHEHHQTNYTVEILKNKNLLTKYNKTLNDNEKIEIPYYIDRTNTYGNNQVLDIKLFEGNQTNPYRSLKIRYNVV